jgi:putative transposase
MPRPVLGLKSFWSAAMTLAGIELMYMIRKGQLQPSGGDLALVEQFYSLAA